MEKAVDAMGLGVTGWVEVAADRAQWRALVRQYGEPEGEVKNNNSNTPVPPPPTIVNEGYREPHDPDGVYVYMLRYPSVSS
jgi:hypothetical protein